MSFGTSPTAPSLLIPSNPAFSPAESAPRGGILINVHRASEPSLTIPEGSSSAGRTSDSESPITPNFPQTHESAFPLPSPSLGAVGGKSLKIRFAPLPDPRRPRSLSTGRNIAWTAQVGEDGEERRALAIRDHDADANEYAIEDEEDDEDDGEEEGEGGADGAGGHKRGRSWSKTMGSSWKGTKKLLSGKNPVSSKEKEKDKEKEDLSAYGAGAPLKKSVSTGGFIGSSPFRWTTEIERKLSMQGSSPPTVTSLLSAHRPSAPATSTPTSPGHRRNSSLEPTTPNRAHRNSSPSLTPIRMMNGRVYGSRRASEAAERERIRREKNEPAFVEWGQGEVATSATDEGGGRGFLGDNDDGGGMAWVKRRREERLRKEQEERERREREREQGQDERAENLGSASDDSPTANRRGDGDGLSSSTSSTSSLDLENHARPRHVSSDLKTPAIHTSDLPPTPIIQISDGDAAPSPHANVPSANAGLPSQIKDDIVGPKGERMSPTPPGTGTGTGTATPIPVGKEKEEHGHVVRAMRIPTEAESKAQAKGKPVDVFGQVETRSRAPQGSYDDDDDDDEEDEEGDEGDEDDEGDYDDDEEEELDAIR
ncbi:hypothetical protein I317_02926 [Kwoniella heveanensis CBS 569]|nr:hypothetical protein I317_02926 [Kwoniella heveanensis CBS 569]